MQNKTHIWMVSVGLLLLGALPMLTGTMQLLTIETGLAGQDVPAESTNYVQNPFPIVIHIFSGIVFGLLGPFQLITALAHKRIRYHRVTGIVFVASGIVAAFSALWMNQYYPAFGGTLKYTSNLFFSIGLLGTMFLAVRAIILKNVFAHRAWMIRAYAIGLGVATQRLLLMPYFVVFGMPEGETLGALLWACWLLNLAVAEWAIYRLNNKDVVRQVVYSS